MDKQTIDFGGVGARRMFGTALIIGHSDHGWFMGAANGPERLGEAPWRKLCDKVFAAALNAKEMRAATLNDEDRRKFLSSAGWLCGVGGQMCPKCREESALAPLGIRSMAELSAK